MMQDLKSLEVKNPQSPPKNPPVEIKIPDDILKIITELKSKKGQLINQFLNLSFQVGELQDKLDETRNKVKTTNDAIGQKIKYAFDKLKLKKKKNYRWSYNGENFIGTLVPEPKKPEKK